MNTKARSEHSRFEEGERVIVVRFGELWLRGKNRGEYIKLLRKNMLSLLDGEDFAAEQGYDRLLLRLSERSDVDSITKKLSYLFGISNYEVAYAARPTLASASKLAGRLLKALPSGSVVRVDAHRSYKGLPFTSIDATRSMIKAIAAAGIEGSSKDYSKTMLLNFTKENAFISLGRQKALHGLPVGSSGKGIVLLSGGIDSPVAAWYAMKRGVEPIYLHVHALPGNNDVLSSKMTDILGILSRYSPHSRIYCVPSHIFQLGAVKAGRYELILLKAFMLRLAERVAEEENARAIFTGESLGQVASQTAENLAAEGLDIRLPILRPLIGFDKDEIIEMAKRIGTYDESIKEYRDVCSINSRNPATMTSVERMAMLADRFGLDRIVGRSLAAADVFEV